MASWLVRSTPELAVRDRALTRDTALCSWARHLTLTMPLSTQGYKWVSANLMLGVTLRWTSLPNNQTGGSRNTPSRFTLLKQDKLRPDGPLGSYADLFLSALDMIIV